MSEGLTDNTTLQRFERVEDGVLAFVNYRMGPGTVALTHFETPLAARGKGMAGRLMQAVVDDARVRGLKIHPQCSYAVDWMERHPEVAAEMSV